MLAHWSDGGWGSVSTALLRRGYRTPIRSLSILLLSVGHCQRRQVGRLSTSLSPLPALTIQIAKSVSFSRSQGCGSHILHVLYHTLMLQHLRESKGWGRRVSFAMSQGGVAKHLICHILRSFVSQRWQSMHPSVSCLALQRCVVWRHFSVPNLSDYAAVGMMYRTVALQPLSTVPATSFYRPPRPCHKEGQ